MNLLDEKNYDTQQLSLLDDEFLATLSEQRERDIYARIIALDINENPVDQIEGRVTGGSINVDGSSVIRRSCSLTMISDNVDINDFYWGIKTKFKLEIGLRNKLTGAFAPGKDSSYPEIVWFPQGYYIVSTFSTSISTNSCSISLQGKDKMCLLNGDLGGQLFASIDFGTEETITSIMEPTTPNLENTSEKIVLGQYYIKPKTYNDVDQDTESLILSKDPYYSFIAANNGIYYKQDNFYKLITPNNPKPIQYKAYEMYKKVKDPEDLFEPMTSTYEQSKFYYKKNDAENKYYILDTSKNGKSVSHYQLKQLYQKTEDIVKKKINIEKIIREAVHAYAQEPYYNIIINDLDDYGLEQLTYKGDKTLYALYHVEAGQFTNLILEGKNESLDNIVSSQSFKFHSLNETTSDIGDLIYLIPVQEDNITVNKFFRSKPDENKYPTYTVAKFTYGMDIGYRLTDLTYTGDLISGVGDTLTSVLDKIKQMLGEFEYFYDLNGNFIFQKKPNYVETSWNQLTDNDDENYVTFANDKKKFSFNFEGNRLISAIQNAPALNNLRNDFIVWGKRKGISGEDLPIHARYAIDKKPVYYKALDGRIYTSNINYAFEQEAIDRGDYEQAKVIAEEIKNFTLQANYPLIGLQIPQKRSDYTWSSGWWHITDWARYYKLLKQTNEEPNETMKFYSSNDENGCVMVKEIANLPGLINSQEYKTDTRSVWLIEINKNTNKVNLGHGRSTYSPNARTCECYKSEIDAQGRITTTATGKTKSFAQPYAGCADTHTYLYFLDRYNNHNQDVYFYNPQFPTGETDADLIATQGEEGLKQWLKEKNVFIVDWREIIYQMALDYFAGQGCSEKQPLYLSGGEFMIDPDHFLYEVGRRNPYYYPTGYTGYEQYYTDMQGFWRKLYNPNYIPDPVYTNGHYTSINVEDGSGYYKKQKQWIEPSIQNYIIDYYIDSDKDEIKAQLAQISTISDLNLRQDLLDYYTTYTLPMNQEEASGRLYWNRQVFESPETLDFWIDFLDSDLELAQYSIRQVGDRTKVVKEDKAGAIIYTSIPNFILYEYKSKNEEQIEVCDESKLGREIQDKSGYTLLFLPKGFAQYFTISYRNMSVKDKIDSLLYQFGYCVENISITAIPIYHLEPNTRIFVQDKNTGINGEYIVSKITLPLTYNGTMSITANKAPERLY